MGGPGVPLLVCRDHLEEAVAELRKIRSALDEPSGEQGASLVDVIDKLVDARQCLVELREEHRDIINYADEIEREHHKLEEAVKSGAFAKAPESRPLVDVDDVERANTADAEFLWMQLSLAGADRGFRSLESFVGWFVGGAAAVIGLLIANLDQLLPFVSEVDIGAMLRKIAVAFGLVVVAKFLGSLISTAAGSAEQAHTILRERLARGEAMPPLVALIAAKKKGTPRVVQALGRWIGGDNEPSILSRRIAGCLGIAGLASIAASCIIGWALYDLASGIDFKPHPAHSAVTAQAAAEPVTGTPQPALSTPMQNQPKPPSVSR